jgi:hypothetical protein
LLSVVPNEGESPRNTAVKPPITVIGTLVGAYFGVKIGTDQTKTAMEQTDRAHSALREEAAKAQAFAAHVPPSEANRALRDAKDLASERPSAPPSKER